MIQQDAKVLQQGRGLAWLSGNALEATDGIWGSQDTLSERGNDELRVRISGLLKYKSKLKQFNKNSPPMNRTMPFLTVFYQIMSERC